MAAALQAALVDAATVYRDRPDLHAQMGAEGGGHIEQNFTWERATQQYKNLLAGHVTGRRQSRCWQSRWSSATDIFSLGQMFVILLNGQLFGEVRKFKTPPLPDGRDEFDMFHDPSFYTDPATSVLSSPQALRDWRLLLQSCLRFRSEDRPSIEAFITQASALVDSHAINGEIVYSMRDNLIAATLVNGCDTLAR